MQRFVLGTLLACLLMAGPPAAAGPDEDGFFAPWRPETFARAKRERRILVLTLSTSWCHWCHVMKRTTWKDPAVRRELGRDFLPMIADADARPDLAQRFRNYRWPAIAFLTPDGQPILAFRGFRDARTFRSILLDVRRRVRSGGPYPGFDDPTQVGGVVPSADLAGLRALRRLLIAELDKHWDPAEGGWGTRQKYPVPEPVAWGLSRARWEGPQSRPVKRALRTLAATRQLIDRIWGGVYQYSVGSTWKQWHPEKIVSVNAGALTGYGLAHDLTGDPGWRRDARDVARWINGTLRAPDGRYQASQDADSPTIAGERLYRLDARGRARFPPPRVDPRILSQENARIVQALVHAAACLSGGATVRQAQATAELLWQTHRDDGGLLRREDRPGVPDQRRYLVDQVAYGRACLALDQALPPSPGDPWLQRALGIARRLEAAFGDGAGDAFHDATADPEAVGVFRTRLSSLEAGAEAARFLLALGRRVGDLAWEARARRAIVAVGSSQQIRAHWRHVAGLLLAVDAALDPWVHVKFVGAKAEGALYEAMRRAAKDHPGTTWSHEIPGPGESGTYVLLCGRGRCGDPLRDPAGLESMIEKFRREEPGLAVEQDGR
jgi:uncharacterized protein YyaL (SSP411 family)